jgi:hypothetical protein
MQALLAILVVAALTSHGAEWISVDAGVSFQLPTDPAWEQIKGPRIEARLVLQRTDRTASVMFIAFEKKPGPRTLDEEFVKRWEKGYYRKGGEKVSGEFFTFKGKRAYKANDRVMEDGVQLLGTVILWLEDDRLFEIVAMKEDGDPMQDRVIKEFVDSLKFLPKSTK